MGAEKTGAQETTAQQFTIDMILQKGLQEQAGQYNVTAIQDKRFYNALEKMHRKRAKYAQKKRIQVKKAAVVVIAATVMALGTISIAAGGIKSMVSHSFNIPDYKSYQDMEIAAAEAGVQFHAPEQFVNGYCFNGIFMVENQYKNDEEQAVDSFISVQVKYTKDGDTIMLEVQPRPMLSNRKERLCADIFCNNETTYYYQEMHNKWVPVDYKPTEEEQQAIAAGTLNIGVGAEQISYSDSKSLSWEINGQQYMIFCMDNNISKEELYAMALEIE